MKALLRQSGLMIALSAMAACSDSGSSIDQEQLTLQDIAGSWTATRVEVTDLETSTTVEWLAAGLVAEFRMAVGASGTLRFSTIAEAGDDPFITTGTIELEGADLTMTLDGAVWLGTASLENGRLTIDIPEEDGERLLMVFRRS